MDPTEDAAYRGFQLNDAVIVNGKLVGCQLSSVLWAGVRGVGYTEKRAQDDGLDAADVFLGARHLRLTGSLYGATRADLFDRKQDLLTAFTPTLAYLDEPDDRGYVPLTFREPTANLIDFASGFKDLQVYMRPLAQPDLTINRDAIGGIAARGGGLQWSVDLEARDPRRYLQVPQEMALTTTGDTFMPNRGDYPAPLIFDLAFASVGSGDPDYGTKVFHFIGLNSEITITCPALVDTVARYIFDVRDNLLYETKDGVTTLRMDLVTIAAEDLPRVPPTGGRALWSLTKGGVDFSAVTGAVRWYEAFA